MNETSTADLERMINVKLTLNEYLYFNFWFLFKKIYFVYYASVFTLGLIIYQEITREFIINGTLFLIVSFPIFIVFILPILIYFVSKASYKSKFVQEEKTYKFSIESIEIESSTTSYKLLWSDVKKIIRNKKLIVLFVEEHPIFIIPTNRFSSKTDLLFVQDILNKNIVLKTPKKLIHLFPIFLIAFLLFVGLISVLIK